MKNFYLKTGYFLLMLVALCSCGNEDDPILDDDQGIKTVEIGTQVWMAENLDVDVPQVDHDDDGRCDEDDIFVWDNGIYGKLYSWEAARIACPDGWHLPSDAEWTELTDFLGGWEVAGGKMKSTTGWDSPNTGATNSRGFSALPGGCCVSDGTHDYQGSYGSWWSSTPYGSYSAYSRNLNYNSATVHRGSVNRNDGRSVRCVRD